MLFMSVLSFLISTYALYTDIQLISNGFIFAFEKHTM